MPEEKRPSPNLNDPKERSRVGALEHYRILDSGSEEPFDKIVDLASNVIDTPISHLSFFDEDRQWFKANLGSKVTERPRQESICDHCVRTGTMLEVEDLSEHPLLKDNPLVQSAPHAKSYLGVPILDPAGHALGILCVVDTKVRSFDEKDRLLLRQQAEHVITLLETRLQEKLKEELNLGSSRRVMEAEEEVKKKLGQKVQNGLQRDLSFFKNFMEQLKEMVHPLDQQAYEDCMETIEGTLERCGHEASRLSKDLTLDGVEEQSLEKALIGLLLPFGRSPKKLEISFEPDLKDDPPPFVKKNLYRIVQELMENTFKHSEASKLEVRLIQDQEWTHLHFRDNGKGLEAGGGADGKGLDSIRARLHALQGEFNLEAAPDSGLAYAIRVPVQ